MPSPSAMRRPFLLAALVAAVGVASAPTRVQAIDGTCRALAMSGGGDKAGQPTRTQMGRTGSRRQDGRVDSTRWLTCFVLSRVPL